jgi:acyl-CoA synthetase (AMP-forming)/AMP-acid ligase II
MIYVHSVQRAARYYPDRHVLLDGDERLTFRQLHARTRGIAAALVQAGFVRGDRLAILLPNSSEYLSLIYAAVGSA